MQPYGSTKWKNTGFMGVFVLGLVLTVTILIAAGASYIHAANLGVETESGIRAKYADNENVYANGTQKVMEVAQVPQLYVESVSRVTREAISGRYGAEGSKAVFQLLVEQNPQLDASIFNKVSQVIEAFRNEFQANQTALLDRCRNYDNLRGYVWSGFWLRVAGYPKIDVTKHCTIVSTDKAQKAFETKRDEGLVIPGASRQY